MWPNQATSSLPKQPWPHLFLFSSKESVGCGWMHYFRVTKKCPGSMVVVVVVVIIRGEAEEEAKAEREFDFVRSFYDVDDFVPCEQTHFWPAKTSSLPSFFGNAYKVPFLPSFPLSKHLQGSVHSFLSMVRHWKKEGRCAQSMWVWEKERVYLLFLNHWRIFFLN